MRMSHSQPKSSAGADPRAVARRAFAAIETPGSDDLAAFVDPSYRNHEADGPARALRGPAAFAATVDHLNRAFSELRFEIHALVADGGLVGVATVMHGVHTGPMRELAPTGRRFAQRQSHWYRVVDGRLTEHWATRDDLGFLHQLGAAPGPRVGQTAGAER
jgi:predicted ester cyclase